ALLALAQRALFTHPDDLTLNQFLVRAALALRQYDAAAAAVRRLAAAAEVSPWSAVLAARSFMATGHDDEAARTLERAARDTADPEPALVLAQLVARSDPRRARAALDGAMARATEPTARARLVGALAALARSRGRSW
ncbi:MAG: hypothetical protein JWM53_1046, partial [bacterium]|nr:hypothetical protein [bacterium]